MFVGALDDEVKPKYRSYGLLYRVLDSLYEFCASIAKTGTDMFDHAPEFFAFLKLAQLERTKKRAENALLSK